MNKTRRRVRALKLIGTASLLLVAFAAAEFATSDVSADRGRWWRDRSSNSNNNSNPTPTSTPRTNPTATPAPSQPSNPGGSENMTRISNPNGPCVYVGMQHNRVIENLDIGPCGGAGIHIDNGSNITIRNVIIRESSTSINVHRASNITIEGVRSIDPRGPFPSGQHVLFDKVQGGVIRNVTGTFSGRGFVEDGINIFESSDILIEGNSITGGRSSAGCGILLDWDAQRITVRNNTIRDIANCGIGVSSGAGHVIEYNDIANYGRTSSTPNTAPHGAGIYVWNQNHTYCGDIQVRFNTVGPANSFWQAFNCRNVTLERNNFYDWPYYTECDNRACFYP